MLGSRLERDSGPQLSAWQLWFYLLTAVLTFASLWVVTLPAWHFGLSVISLILLWRYAVSPLRTLLFILGLVTLLAFLQILFSAYMRNLLVHSWQQGFKWEQWQYLFFAVERFAWPLAVIYAVGAELTNPQVVSKFTTLLLPWKWLGLKIEKLQIMILLALRFIPMLQQEWDRYAHFQTYFQSVYLQRSLLQKLRYGQGILRALIAHSFHHAMVTGDLLALRGLPGLRANSLGTFPPTLGLLWFILGGVFVFLDVKLGVLWGLFSVWMGLAAVAQSQWVNS